MDTDDPRHGTRAGYYAHRRADQTACDPCKRAACREFNQRSLNASRGIPTSYPPHTIKRRIHALIAIGWHNAAIAERLGVTVNMVQAWESHNYNHVRVSTYRKVAAVYEAMSMTFPPDSYGARRARARAAARGYATPLMWDDIDSDPAPIGKRRAGTDYDSSDIVDEATVLRILSGEVLPANTAEKREVMRRWLAAGHSERSLCERMGWKESRYSKDDAA